MRQTKAHLGITVLLALAIAGCAGVRPKKESELDKVVAAFEQPQPAAGAETAPFQSTDSSAGLESANQRSRPQIYPGNAALINVEAGQAAPAEPVKEDAEGVSLNFDNAPLAEVVKTILGDTLGYSFSLEPGLQGTVSLSTVRPVPRKDLLDVLDSFLVANGATLIRTADGHFRVGPRPLLKGLGAPVTTGGDVPGFGYRVVALKFVGALEMQKILEPLAPAGAVVRVDGVRNMLVLGGTRRELANMLQTIDVFDVDVLKGMSVGIYPVENVSAKQMAESLDALFGKGGETPLSGLFRIIPLDNASRVMVVTSRSNYLKEISTWVARLDFDDGTDSRLYVYPVQNGKAERLAELLSELFGGKAESETYSRGDVAPGHSAQTIGDGAGTGIGTGSASAGGGGLGSGVSGLPTSMSSASARGYSLTSGFEGLADQVRVVADTENNTLLILANAGAYRSIENALQRLDLQPLQVLIEASIVEVTLTDELEYGLQWYFDGKSGSRTHSFQLDGNDTAGLAPQIPGFSWTIADGAGIINAVFNALAKDSRLRVISSPSILVLDNHTAEIRVGDQQPVSTSTTTNTSNADVVTQNIEFKDTGVLLEVKPRVNAGGLVIMEVAQEVTDVGNVDTATGQRSFLQRNIKSTVAVQSGETIVLGGLIRDNSSRGESGLPILHKLPGIGWLFGNKSNNDKRTELLVTLTPRAVRNTAEATQVGDEMRARMQGLLKEMSVR